MPYPRLAFFSFSIVTIPLLLSGCGGITKMSSNTPTSGTGPAPTVVAVGEQVNGVAPNRLQEVQFSEAMDSATINAQSFQITDSSGKAAAGTVSYDPDFNTASFLPNPALQTGANYTATITAAVASSGGMHLASPYTYTFTTRDTTDTSPISVNSVVPAANATCVSPAAPITITFNEAPDPATVIPGNFMVSGPNGAIAVKISMNVTTTQVVLTPGSALPSGAITVMANNVADMAGVKMASSYTWSFSTVCSGGTGGGTGGGGGSGGSGGGNGQVSFSTTTYPSGDFLWNANFRPRATLIADLNGDGRDDFASTGCSNGGFSVRLSTGDGAYGPANCYNIPTAPLVPTDFTGGDFFGNGHISVAVQDERGNLSIWKNDGVGVLTLAWSTTFSDGQGGIWAGDVNHDGKVDLVHLRPNETTGIGATLTVFLGNGDGTFTAGPVTTLTTQVAPFAVAGGDFDGDGNVDLVASDISSEETQILYGDGTGKFTPGPSIGGSTLGTNSSVITDYQPFDVNADGIMDLIGAPYNYTSCGNGCYPPPPTGNNFLDVEFGHSGRTLTSQKIPLANCAASAAPPQVADFDGDGIPDIVVAEGACQGGGSETLDFLKGNGNGTFRPEQVIYTTNDLIDTLFVIKSTSSGKPGLAVYQFQDVNKTVTNPEELIMVNTTP